MADRETPVLQRRSVLAAGTSALTGGLCGCAGILDGTGDGGSSGNGTRVDVYDCTGDVAEMAWEGPPSTRWPQRRADARNSRSNPEATGPSLDAGPRTDASAEIYGTNRRLDDVLIAGGRAYFQTEEATKGIGTASGYQRLSVAVRGWSGTHCLHDGVLYRTDAGWLEALNPELGCRYWATEVTDGERGELVVTDQLLLVSTGNDGVYALERSTGQERWRAGPETFEGECYRLGTDDETAYLETEHDLWALELDNGDVRWTTGADQALPEERFGLPVVGEDRVFVVADGRLLALSKTDGSVDWRSPEERLTDGPPSLGARHLFVPSADEGLLAISRSDGTVAWHQDGLSKEIESPPVPASNGLYLAEDGAIERLDPETGTVQATLDSFDWDLSEMIVTEGQAFVQLLRGHHQTVLLRVDG